jgi:hypothetical protein
LGKLTDSRSTHLNGRFSKKPQNEEEIMQGNGFDDYYEILEVSPNASSETIERVFRYLAKRYHPDASDAGDNQKFSLLVQAYDVLKDPQRRAAYDAEHAKYQQHNSELVAGAGSADRDSVDRRSLLSLFYAQRRRDMKNPGIGIGTLEHIMHCPEEVLGFHVWYFREKGWIQREPNGYLSITAEGVDQIELSGQRIAQTHERLIEMQSPSIAHETSSRELAV